MQVNGTMVETLGFTSVCALFKPLTLFPLVGPLRSTLLAFGKVEIFARLLFTFFFVSFICEFVLRRHLIIHDLMVELKKYPFGQTTSQISGIFVV